MLPTKSGILYFLVSQSRSNAGSMASKFSATADEAKNMHLCSLFEKMHRVSGNCHTVHFKFFTFLIWLQLGHTHVVGTHRSICACVLSVSQNESSSHGLCTTKNWCLIFVAWLWISQTVNATASSWPFKNCGTNTARHHSMQRIAHNFSQISKGAFFISCKASKMSKTTEV